MNHNATVDFRNRDTRNHAPHDAPARPSTVPTNVIKTDVATSTMLYGRWTDDRIAAHSTSVVTVTPRTVMHAWPSPGPGPSPLDPTAPWHRPLHCPSHTRSHSVGLTQLHVPRGKGSQCYCKGYGEAAAAAAACEGGQQLRQHTEARHAPQRRRRARGTSTRQSRQSRHEILASRRTCRDGESASR